MKNFMFWGAPEETTRVGKDWGWGATPHSEHCEIGGGLSCLVHNDKLDT